MRRYFKATLVVALSLLCGLANAGPYEDAQTALEKQDYATAGRLFTLSATQGDVRAQTMLGMFYRTGTGGIIQDQVKANEWFELAANQGWPVAQVALGEAYAYGWGVRQNWREAIRLFTLAADKGLALAQRNLGDAYGKGAGMTRDYKLAIDWYLKAAKQGDVEAQFSLGYLFSQGMGAAQNYALAATWYGQAAQQGNPNAQSSLGMLYNMGNGVPQDYATAVTLFRLAAQQGNVLGQVMLGDSYGRGLGVPKDDVRAYMWINLGAADAGSAQASVIAMRNTAASKLYPAQVQEAQALGRRCIESKFADCGPDSKIPVQTAAAAGAAPQSPAPQGAARAPASQGPKLASTGTGFFVSSQGHIITNAHVVDGCKAVVSQRDGELDVIAVDDESDLALLAGGRKQPDFARLRGGRGARVGESVMAMGFPYYGTLAKEPIVTTGIISALAGLENDRRTIQISAPVQPGNSGGPLIGETGALVGVVNSGLDALQIAEERGSIPQNVNFAVSLGTLQAFLNVHSVPYALDTSSAIKRTSDISAEAMRYTMVLGCFK